MSLAVFENVLDRAGGLFFLALSLVSVGVFAAAAI